MIAVASAAWAAATTSVSLWAWYASRARPRSGRGAAAADLLVLRPCAGAEPRLAETLASSSEAPAGAAIRLLVASHEDGARVSAEASAAALREADRDARVVVTGARGPNKKADQLDRALAAEPRAREVVVVADSDVVLSRELVEQLVLALEDVDAAWAAPIEVDAKTAADRASGAVLDASLHAFALLSALDPACMVGKVFAIRTGALDAIGGFGALVRHLGEDMEIASRLRGCGRRARVVARAARSAAAGRSWREVVARYARWITVIRAQRPLLLASYPLLLAAAPLQLALATVAIALGDLRVGSVAVAAALGGRWLTAAFARARSGRPVPGPMWPLAADAVLLASFALALASRTLRWRGAALRVGADGALVEVES